MSDIRREGDRDPRRRSPDRSAPRDEGVPRGSEEERTELNDELLMRYIDGELSEEEEERVGRLLSGSGARPRAEELDRFLSLKGELGELHFRGPADPRTRWFSIRRRLLGPSIRILALGALVFWLLHGGWSSIHAPGELRERWIAAGVGMAVILLLAATIVAAYRRGPRGSPRRGPKERGP